MRVFNHSGSGLANMADHTGFCRSGGYYWRTLVESASGESFPAGFTAQGAAGIPSFGYTH